MAAVLPAARAAGGKAVALVDSPHRHGRRPGRPRLRQAVLPSDALGALPTAAAAATAASLLTALWLRQAQGKGPASDPDSQGEEPEPQEAEEPPCTAEGIWAAAWQGFAEAAQQPAAAAAGPAAGDTVQQRIASDAAQQPPTAAQAADEQTDLADEDAPQADQASADGGLQRHPVLLLQGIRASDRSQLLALCLAGLEAQVSALPTGAGPPAASPTQWRQLSTALLALSSVAAAAAWLGYVPAQLLEAAARQLAACDPAALQAAGLQPAAAALQRQAASNEAAGGQGDIRRVEEERDEEEGKAGTSVDWYCLEEKLQVYSSILRLLTCTTIQQQQPAPPEPEQPAGAAEEAAAAGHPAGPAEAAWPATSVPAPADTAGVARRQALLALQQQQQGGASGDIRGWRATAAGTRNDSQLLVLAPSVLQDMAVTAADAVAAAYLADAATAGPTLADAAGSEQAATQQQQQQQEKRRRWPRGWWLRARSSSGEEGSAALAVGDGGSLLGPLAEGSPGGGTGGGASGTAGSPLEAGWWPTFVHPQLGSTRQLQRFANRVALNRWVRRNYRGVADIYEDRLLLFGVTAAGRRLLARSAPLKRTPELGRLTGLRYAASLLLEAVDLAAPLLRALWGRATAAASWLLVRLVGQAAALLRRGMQRGGGRWGEAVQDGPAAAAPSQPRGSTQEQRRQPGRGAAARRRGQRRGSDDAWPWAWQQ